MYKTNKFLSLCLQANALAIALLIGNNTLAQTGTGPMQTIQITPQTNINAQIQQLDTLGNYQLIQPDKSTLILEKVSRFEVADFNFDKYPDVLVIRDKGLNTQNQLYVYQPQSKRFELLKPPAELEEKMACKDFTNLQIVFDTEKKPIMLSVSCMGKRSTEIYFDQLKFDENAKLWLNRQYLYEPVVIPDALLSYTDLPWGITEKMTEYTQQGQVATTYYTSQALEPVVVKILNVGLTLLETPAQDAKALLTLKRGQICYLSGLKEDWLQMQCDTVNSKKSTGWLHLPTVLRGKERPFMITESSLAKQY